MAHEMVRDATGVVGAVMAGAGVRAGGAAATTSSDRELASETMRLRAMEAVLSQPRGAPLSLSEQVVALYAVSHPELARLMGVKTGDAAGRGHDPLDALRGGRDSPLLEHFRAQSDTAALMHEIDSDLQLGTARTKRLELLLRVFFQLWSAGAITAQSKKNQHKYRRKDRNKFRKKSQSKFKKKVTKSKNQRWKNQISSRMAV